MKYYGCTKNAFSILPALVAVVIFCSSSLHGQLIFNIGTTGNADVDNGFQMAADFWSSRYDDDVTINIDAGFSDLGGNVLGSSRNTSTNYSLSAFQNAMMANVVTADDQTFVDALPTGSLFSAYANNTAGNPNGTGYYSANLSNVFVNRANAKALGLIDGQNAASDSTITFNSTFSFDFDPSDGISAGQLDFVGIAIHEIGHTMGFSSSVDIISSFGDQVSISSLGPNVLDFTRFSPDSVTAAGAIDLTSDTRAKYFSIDGGVTAAAPGLNHWSLGGANDGRQASHWKDDLGLGIMDPTSAPEGQLNVATELDFLAIDVIGWDRVTAVPEPGSLLFITTMAVGLCFRRRRV